MCQQRPHGQGMCGGSDRVPNRAHLLGDIFFGDIDSRRALRLNGVTTQLAV